DMTVVSSGAAAPGDKPAAAAAVAPAPAAAIAAEAPASSPDVPPKTTDMDKVVDGKGLPIPVDTDPLSSGSHKRGATAEADVAPAAEPAAPGSVPASDGD